MEALDTVLLAATLVPAIWLLVKMERARPTDPDHVRRFGAALEALAAGDELEVIGHYDGVEIYACVFHLGMCYRFDRVVPAAYRRLVGARELFVEPGVLYVTD